MIGDDQMSDEEDSRLVRFGVAVPRDLLTRFDQLVESKRYIGRSEAIRDAMRLYISQAEWETGQSGQTAAVNIVYEHRPRLMQELITLQHKSEAHIVSAVHVHLTRTHCLEVLTVKGSRQQIEEFSDGIVGLPGVEYARVFYFSLPEEEDHQNRHEH